MKRALIAIPLLILLAGLFFVLRPDPPAAEPKAQTFDLRVEDDSMTPEEIEVREGDRVKLRVESDAPVEFHVHGYDLEREAEPDETATLSFTADITGRFDIEGHPVGSDEHEEDHSHAGEDGHEHDDGRSDAHSRSEEAATGTLTVLPR